MEDSVMKDKDNICKHEWIYEDMMYLTNPPKQNRICKKCGATELYTHKEKENNYKDIFDKFHGNKSRN
jgi:hypothetical protein